MATVNYSISTVSGLSWTGTFEVANFTDIVSSTVPSSFTANSGAVSFTPAQVVSYTSPTNDAYVTWRSSSIGGQYPTTGWSFDIWSLNLYNAIASSATWTTLKTTATYTLNSNKNTLVYNYDDFYAPFYGSGGTITFT
jgi:hypothetical protein